MIASVLQDPRLRHRLFESGFFYGDLETDFGYTSKTLRRLGFSDREMRNGEYQKRIHPDDLPTYEALWQRVNEGWDDELHAEYRVCNSEGRWFWIETHAVVLSRRKDNTIGKIIGTDRDISARKEAERVLEQQVREALRHLEVTGAILQSGTLATEEETLIQKMQSAIEQLARIVEFERCDLYGSTEEEPGPPLLTVPSGEDDTGPLPEPFNAEVTGSTYPVIRSDIAGRTPYRSAMGINLTVHDTTIGTVYLWHSEPGMYGGTELYPVMTFASIVAVTLYNFQEYRRAVAELETDELTGFLTRKHFFRKLAVLWQELSTSGGTHTIAMIDLDHFKEINDYFGHSTGDSVITSVAAAIRRELRAGDILGRYGGEEFIVVLLNTELESARHTLERIRRACESEEISGLPRPVTCSIGFAVTGTDRSLEPIDEMIRRADAALYRAKRNGRNRVELAGAITVS
ncbi:MAG: diguanylate cyclase [Alkalispirochaeta sp.]